MTVSLLIIDPGMDLAEVMADHLVLSRPNWTTHHALSVGRAQEVLTRRVYDAAVVHAALGEVETEVALTMLQTLQPDCVRLLMANPEVLEAPRDLVSPCHRVLVEPCSPLALCVAIEHARRLRDVLGRSGVRALGVRRRRRASRRPTGDLLSTV